MRAYYNIFMINQNKIFKMVIDSVTLIIFLYIAIDVTCGSDTYPP